MEIALGLLWLLLAGSILRAFHVLRHRDPWELPPPERPVQPLDWRGR